MQREMRRKKQKLGLEETVAIMRQATSGVLALEGDDGYPYAVPMSFAWVDQAGEDGSYVGRIYFHSAPKGYKIDSIMDYEKASFAVVAQDQIVPEELTTYFRSAIATGRIQVLESDVERVAGLRALAEKYSPGFEQKAEDEISSSMGHVAVLALDVEELTGKEARELMVARKAQSEA